MSAFAPVIHALRPNRGATAYSLLADDLDESAPHPVRVARAALGADGPVCADGYRPLCNALWAAATLVGPPIRSDMRLVLSAARRLDGAHVQLERVRRAIDELGAPGAGAGPTATHELIGDAELAVAALAGALDLARTLCRREPHLGELPGAISHARRRVKRLRDHYGRVDTRALRLLHRSPDLGAEAAFRRDPLIADRTYGDGKRSLAIDDETTELFIATRRYLMHAWIALVDREARSAPSPVAR